MLYNFSNEEKEILQALGENTAGVQFLRIIKKLIAIIGDVGNIEGPDVAAQVEGRKLTKEVLLAISKEMRDKVESGKESNDEDYS